MQLLHQRIKTMSTRYSKVYESVNGSLVYLCGCVEKLTHEMTDVKQVLEKMHDRSMTQQLVDDKFDFPLKSKDEVQAYLKKDPTCEAALNRYLKHAPYLNDHCISVLSLRFLALSLISSSLGSRFSLAP